VINTPKHMSTSWAAEESQRLLRNEPVGRRLHSVSVGLKATCLARQLGRDGDVLIAAAYLHDIGYSYELRRTDFHPLDGASTYATEATSAWRVSSLITLRPYTPLIS
jgi:putative nucleotidyltransferase with HDIG domain